MFSNIIYYIKTAETNQGEKTPTDTFIYSLKHKQVESFLVTSEYKAIPEKVLSCCQTKSHHGGKALKNKCFFYTNVLDPICLGLFVFNGEKNHVVDKVISCGR